MASSGAAAAEGEPARAPGMGVAERYERIRHLGTGQFGVVFSAKDVVTGALYAVKKIKVGKASDAKEGLNRSAFREVKLLQELRHPNIVQLQDVFARGPNINLVFELCHTDMENVIGDKSIFLSPGDIKSLLLMTLQGLEYMHDNWVLHRDLKPGNLLVSAGGVVKITDFGLATFYGSPSRRYTSQVATRWYRAPELLFGARLYGTSVDVWSIGCIQAELELRNPLFPAETDLEQLTTIFSCVGTCTEADWPGMSKLPDFVDFTKDPKPKTPFRDILSAAGDDATDLIEHLLICDPAKRLTTRQALQHPYFTNEPFPTAPQRIPLGKPVSEKDKAAEAAPVLKRNVSAMRDFSGNALSKRLRFD